RPVPGQGRDGPAGRRPFRRGGVDAGRAGGCGAAGPRPRGPRHGTTGGRMSRLAWAYLNRVVEGPSRPLQQLLHAGRDAEEIAHGIRTRASWLGDLAGQTEARHTWDRAEEDLAAAAVVGARLIAPDPPAWRHAALDRR